MKKVQLPVNLALQGNIPLIKIGIGIGTEKNIMEQLAPLVLPDTIALTAKALLCAEIIIIKMKQEKQPVRAVQQELIAQILQALHAQVVMENAQPAIKALQIAQAAQVGTTYQAQVATHVQLMPVAMVQAHIRVIADIHLKMEAVPL